jgi:hypothetical protein
MNEMTKHFNLMKKAEGLWLIEVNTVWVMDIDDYESGSAIIQYNSYMKNLEAIERMRSPTIKPVSLERTFRFCHV